MRSKQPADLTTSSKSTTTVIPATAQLSTHIAQPPPPATLPDTRSHRSSMHAFVTLLRSPAGFLRSSVTKRTRSSLSSSNVVLPAVVLQTYSTSTEGIVLTALPTAPFCCHEDLLTMSRERLEDVVRALNEKLPRRMRIGGAVEGGDVWVGDDEDIKDGIAGMSDAEIRKKIEVLVGVRKRGELGDLSVPFESVPPDAPTLELPGTCTHAEPMTRTSLVRSRSMEVTPKWSFQALTLCTRQRARPHVDVVIHCHHLLPFRKSTRPRNRMTLESRANGEWQVKRLKI
ncbi:hypothetical protein EDD16DRAFT_74733 [Pisolithus croceorrhizus]|nr:hypothetical protein EDD16DRAFT_74733 [Pisolithus croceorrhizus]